MRKPKESSVPSLSCLCWLHPPAVSKDLNRTKRTRKYWNLYCQAGKRNKWEKERIGPKILGSFNCQRWTTRNQFGEEVCFMYLIDMAYWLTRREWKRNQASWSGKLEMEMMEFIILLGCCFVSCTNHRRCFRSVFRHLRAPGEIRKIRSIFFSLLVILLLLYDCYHRDITLLKVESIADHKGDTLSAVESKWWGS